MTPVPRRTGLVLISVCALAAMETGSALAAAGNLDVSFGGDGKVTTNFTGGFDGARGVAVQMDGKIVVAGVAAGAGGRFALARYNGNGTLDDTFGGDGRVTTNLTAGDDGAHGVAIQGDGKIVAAGGVPGSGGRFAMTRYNPDGSLDSTFSGNGKLITDFTDGDDEANGVAIQSNGKIVAAGSADSNCSCSKFALARYGTDGTLDASFAGDGKVTTHFQLGSGANGVAIQANGKIVAAGGGPDFNRFAVARYNLNGALDPNFSGNGKVTTNMGQGEESATAVAMQSNGKIVAGGYTDIPHEFGDTFGPGKFAVARYRVDGTLDPGFRGDGKAKTRFGHKGASAHGVTIQADGKIIAAGLSGNGERFALARYRLNGTLDDAFGGDGRVTTKFTAGEDIAFGVAVQADGRIVAAGHAAGSGFRFALARYLGA